MKKYTEVSSVRELLQRIKYLEKENERLKKFALVDDLTGLPNRKAYTEALLSTHKVALREKSKRSVYAIAFIDVDLFKKINDVHGHAGGDEVLRTLGQVIRKNKRPSDGAFRIGGEEFVVIMPNTDSMGARAFAIRLHSTIEDTLKAWIDGVSVHATVSIGVAVWNGSETSAKLVARADIALYKAKENGRNHVHVFGDT